MYKTRAFISGIALLIGTMSMQSAPAAEAESWKIDPVHSTSLFRIHHAGAGRFWGRFNDVTGSVSWPRDDSTPPAFDVIVAAESIDTGSSKLDGNLKSPDFFNAREFESISFKSTGGERVKKNHWRVKGDLTMLGVTKPVTAEIEMTGVVGNPVVAKAGWEARFAVNRSDFGMSWGVDNGALSDDVQLIVALEGSIEPGN